MKSPNSNNQNSIQHISKPSNTNSPSPQASTNSLRPSTVSFSISLRIIQLGPGKKHIHKTAILGNHFPFSIPESFFFPRIKAIANGRKKMFRWKIRWSFSIISVILLASSGSSGWGDRIKINLRESSIFLKRLTSSSF